MSSNLFSINTVFILLSNNAISIPQLIPLVKCFFELFLARVNCLVAEGERGRCHRLANFPVRFKSRHGSSIAVSQKKSSNKVQKMQNKELDKLVAGAPKKSSKKIPPHYAEGLRSLCFAYARKKDSEPTCAISTLARGMRLVPAPLVSVMTTVFGVALSTFALYTLRPTLVLSFTKKLVKRPFARSRTLLR